MSELDQEKLAPDDGVPIPRLRLGETGWSGLKVSQGVIQEQRKKDLRWPKSICTYKCMAEDVTIASAIAFVEMMISRVDWRVEVDDDADDKTKERAEFIESCMDDMEHTWFSFIKEATSAYTYGFSVHEKVFRRRLSVNGSKYNDGKIGIRKLPIRSQDSIKEWKFSDDGRELQGVVQDLTGMNQYRYSMAKGSEITIPREKFLLFRTDVKKDNPEGNSPLNAVYDAWKIRSSLEEAEAVGITRNLGGLPVIYLPPAYMSEDATESERQIYEYYKNIIRNIHNNEQSGLILPSLFDPESRQPLFKFDLMAPQGGSTYSATDAITRWDNKILQCLFADVLKLGNDKVGSYSLADSKSSISVMAIEHRLKEIRDVLNKDLIPQLYQLNGWSLDNEDMPKFEYGDLENIDLEEFSKFVQRIKAVGLITPTPGNVNRIAEIGGLPDRVEEDMDQDELNELLGPDTSRSGDGMSTGSGNGTSKSVSKRDNSASNSENAA